MASIGEFRAARRQMSGDPDTFDFEGETFTVASGVGSMPLMDFAAAVNGGVSEGDALVAVRDLLRDCLIPEDWPRFRETAIRTKAQIDDLMPIAQAVWESVSGRPTEKPSDSSAGLSSTSGSSKAASLELVRGDFTPVDDLLAAAGS